MSATITARPIKVGDVVRVKGLGRADVVAVEDGGVRLRLRVWFSGVAAGGRWTIWDIVGHGERCDCGPCVAYLAEITEASRQAYLLPLRSR